MLLSEIEFGSYLTYCPRGNDDEIRKSKDVMLYIKNESSIGQPPKFMSRYVVEMIKEKINNLPFNNFFGDNVSLVPVPKSSLVQKDTLWVPDKIARSLVNQKLGIYCPCLERIKKIPKAAFSKSIDRPRAIDHYNSIKVKSILPRPQQIILIDDVVTRGATLIGCASKLNEIYPNIPIKGFAILRTISKPEDFVSIKQPCIGKITLDNGFTHREP